CETGLSKLRCQNAVSRPEPDMQRFGHCTKVTDDPAGHRCRNTQGHLNLGSIETEQFGAGSSRAEGAQRAGSMPAAMPAVAERVSKLPRDFEAGGIGLDQLTAIRSEGFAQSES